MGPSLAHLVPFSNLILRSLSCPVPCDPTCFCAVRPQFGPNCSGSEQFATEQDDEWEFPVRSHVLNLPATGRASPRTQVSPHWRAVSPVMPPRPTRHSRATRMTSGILQGRDVSKGPNGVVIPKSPQRECTTLTDELESLTRRATSLASVDETVVHAACKVISERLDDAGSEDHVRVLEALQIGATVTREEVTVGAMHPIAPADAFPPGRDGFGLLNDHRHDDSFVRKGLRPVLRGARVLSLVIRGERRPHGSGLICFWSC